jgi:hypothetical protein
MAQSRFPAPERPSGEMLDIAQFVTRMTAQLEAMAKDAGLDVLAFFLDMAKAEGTALISGSSQVNDTKVAPSENAGHSPVSLPGVADVA